MLNTNMLLVLTVLLTCQLTHSIQIPLHNGPRCMIIES